MLQALHGVYHLGRKYAVLATESGPQSAALKYMTSEVQIQKMSILGTVTAEKTTVPFYDCGYGDVCVAGHAIALRNCAAGEISPSMPINFQDNIALQQKCKDTAWIIDRASGII